MNNENIRFMDYTPSVVMEAGGLEFFKRYWISALKACNLFKKNLSIPDNLSLHFRYKLDHATMIGTYLY